MYCSLVRPLYLLLHTLSIFAGVVQLADTTVSKSVIARYAGSSPAASTIYETGTYSRPWVSCVFICVQDLNLRFVRSDCFYRCCNLQDAGNHSNQRRNDEQCLHRASPPLAESGCMCLLVYIIQILILSQRQHMFAEQNAVVILQRFFRREG